MKIDSPIRVFLASLTVVLVIAALLFAFDLLKAEGDDAKYFEPPAGLEAETGPPYGAGKIIVSALEKYRAEKGKYPTGINELVPKYLDSIPLPGWGTNKWEYWTSADKHDSFELGVGKNASDYPYVFYISTDRHWSYDT